MHGKTKVMFRTKTESYMQESMMLCLPSFDLTGCLKPRYLSQYSCGIIKLLNVYTYSTIIGQGFTPSYILGEIQGR